MNKKLTIGLCAAVAVLGIGYASFLFFDRNTNQGEKAKIKVGHLVALDMAPMFVAKEAGYFKDEGLDVETIFFANPGDNNAALAGGSIQFGINPYTLHYLGENSGVPMRIISSAGGLEIMQVIIQGKHNVSTLEDLAKFVKANPKTKLKIATLKGDTLEMILYRMFDKAGVKADDFEMVWFNDLLAMVEAFRSKQVDILSHIRPYTTELVLNNGAKVLINNGEAWGYGTPNCTVAVLDDYLVKNPKSVKAYLRAVDRGFQLIVDNPEKAVELLAKGNYYKVDPKVLLYAFKNQPKEVLLRPNVDGMMLAVNDMVKMGYLKSPKEDIVRLKLLDEVIKEKSK